MIELAELGKISILIVEDDSFNQELATAIFDEYKETTVFTANNGKKALEILEKEKVDIILLDLMMPEMNGFETLEILKKSPVYRHIPVIIVTSEENERKSTYKLGANDFISKPYNPTELKLRVLNNLKIKLFGDLIEDIEIDTQNNNIGSADYLKNIKNALKLADNSQKQLLAKLGTLAHQNSHNDAFVSERLGNYIALLGNLYGLGKREIDDMFYAMSIYDIGLLRVPTEELDNAESPLFKAHPTLGLEMLEDLEETNLIKMAKIITLNHHEKWDGTGYPKGLKEEEIPLYARLASIVDYYDELTHTRSYDKETMDSYDALEVIKRERGAKLDPALTNLFIAHFQQFDELKKKFT